MQELEHQFNADGGTFEEYKIGKLFEKQTLRFKKRKFNKVNDVSKDKTVEFTIPLVNAKAGDNGIMYYGRESDFETAEMCIDIVNDGAVSTGNVYPQPQKTGVLYNAYLVKPIFKANEELLIYCAQALQKSIKLKFGYDKKASWERVQDEFVSLPTLNGEISFAYMENVIRELQDERISKLNDYLKESGLENMELSQDEKDAVFRLREGNVKWMEFKVCGETGVFNVNNTHSIMQSQIVPNSGDIPYVTAGESNNSISTYVSYDMDQIEKGNSIMIGGKTLVITYQECDYFSNDSHNIACYVKDEKGKTKEAQLFLVSTMYKSMKPKYSWGDSISGKKIKTDTIYLPITSNGKIDWDFMQNLISAESRLAIRGVVVWK